MLRVKQIAEYRASLIKTVVQKGIVLTVVTGLAFALIAALKNTRTLENSFSIRWL